MLCNQEWWTKMIADSYHVELTRPLWFIEIKGSGCATCKMKSNWVITFHLFCCLFTSKQWLWAHNGKYEWIHDLMIGFGLAAHKSHSIFSSCLNESTYKLLFYLLRILYLCVKDVRCYFFFLFNGDYKWLLWTVNRNVYI